MKIDIEQLRGDLMDYYGTAMFNASPMAMMEVSHAEYADDDELIAMAENAGLDLNDYYEADDGLYDSEYEDD